MAKVAAATTETFAEEVKRIEIDPRRMKCVDENQSWRTWEAYMPPEATADDVQDPNIWRRCQLEASKAIGLKDYVHIFAADMSWVRTGRCWKSTSRDAWLRFKEGAFVDVVSTLWTDGTLKVKFENGSYGVHRVKDDIRVVVQGFSTEAQAIEAALRFYPKAVA